MYSPQAGRSRHLSAKGGVGGGDKASSPSEPSQGCQRELVNMEIRIRDLESRLSEKDTLIRLLQRASIDREIVYASSAAAAAASVANVQAPPPAAPSTRLPESVSLLNRLPAASATSQAHLFNPMDVLNIGAPCTKENWASLHGKALDFFGRPDALSGRLSLGRAALGTFRKSTVFADLFSAGPVPSESV